MRRSSIAALGHALALTAGLLVAAAMAPVAAFDCGGAASAVERRICADPTLRALDRRLDQLLERARVHAGRDEQDRLKREQRAWLHERNACASDACLRRVYEARAAALQQRLARLSATETPFERCAQLASGRLERSACLDHLLATVERDLAVALDGALQTAGDGGAAALGESEAAWQRFRELECARQAGLAGDAAMTADVARSCRIAHAEWRLLDLLPRD